MRAKKAVKDSELAKEQAKKYEQQQAHQQAMTYTLSDSESGNI